MKFDFKEEKNYFLVPVMPTPNGRMHLGHIAGPYLKMDVLKRKVQRGTGVAYLYSGSDVFESYVELKASQINKSPNDICNYYHKLILADFKALNIDFDEFINPLDSRFFKSFIEFYRVLNKSLIETSSLVEKEEIFLYDVENNRYITGCWLSGVCPNCNKNTGSYLCESCGTHYRPQDVATTKNYPNAEIRKKNVIYVKLDEKEILRRLSQMDIEPFESIFKRFLELQGSVIRLTTLQNTGIPWELDEDKKHVLFSYTSLLFFSIYCGEICKASNDLEFNPFDSKSDFLNVASFGIDTTIPYLAGVLGTGIELHNYKPFDYFLTNYFYYLENQKFSTSRSHVIWGNDIVSKSNIQSDSIRYYLSRENPEFEEKNFDINQFIDLVNNDLAKIFNSFVNEALGFIEVNKEYILDENFYSKIRETVLYQNNCMTPSNFRFSEFSTVINKWVEKYSDQTQEEKIKKSYWWLKTFVYLSYPLMPQMSIELWKYLSIDQEINEKTFFESRFMNSTIDINFLFKKINIEELRLSIPKTLSKFMV